MLGETGDAKRMVPCVMVGWGWIGGRERGVRSPYKKS